MIDLLIPLYCSIYTFWDFAYRTQKGRIDYLLLNNFFKFLQTTWNDNLSPVEYHVKVMWWFQTIKYTEHIFPMLKYAVFLFFWPTLRSWPKWPLTSPRSIVDDRRKSTKNSSHFIPKTKAKKECKISIKTISFGFKSFSPHQIYTPKFFNENSGRIYGKFK